MKISKVTPGFVTHGFLTTRKTGRFIGRVLSQARTTTLPMNKTAMRSIGGRGRRLPAVRHGAAEGSNRASKSPPHGS